MDSKTKLALVIELDLDTTESKTAVRNTVDAILQQHFGQYNPDVFIAKIEDTTKTPKDWLND